MPDTLKLGLTLLFLNLLPWLALPAGLLLGWAAHAFYVYWRRR
jgi:hypothetical protein